MEKRFLILVFFSLLLACIPVASAQTPKLATPVTAPPKLLLLVYRQIKPGAESERHKLETQMSRACDGLSVPNSWIDLEAITGEPKTLSFDPFDSFAQVDQAFVGWSQIYAAHPELAQLQQQINSLVTSERTIIAVRRDDLGYRRDFIDLSKMRFMRVLQVRLRPGFENSFEESFKILGAAYERINATTPWVVYQVNVGMPSPSFLVFVPMHALQQNDDLLAWRKDLRQAEGEAAVRHMEETAKEAYESTESNLYAVSPEVSHVTKEFADGDPQFWSSDPRARREPNSPKKP
jgi:hypothetical protein